MFAEKGTNTLILTHFRIETNEIGSQFNYSVGASPARRADSAITFFGQGFLPPHKERLFLPALDIIFAPRC